MNYDEINITEVGNTESSSFTDGSGHFLNRLESSLITGGEAEAEKETDEEVIDVEEVIELNLQKEIDRRAKRKKRAKSRNKHKDVDPRLFPSYYTEDEDDEEKSGDDDDDDDESRLEVFEDKDKEGESSSRADSSDESNTTEDANPFQIMSAIQGRKVIPLSVIMLPATLDDVKEKRKAAQILRDSQKEGIVRNIYPDKDTTIFGSPVRLLEIEQGRAILLMKNNDTIRNSKTSMSVVAVKETMVPETPDVAELTKKRFVHVGLDVRDLEETYAKLGIMDIVRGIKLQRRLVRSMDDVNALSLGRQIQSSIPFLTGYESYLLGQVVQVLDGIVLDSYLLDQVMNALDTLVPELDVSNKTRRHMKEKRRKELQEILRCALKNHNVTRIIVQNIKVGMNFRLHWFQRVLKNRWYRFPASENFPSPGNWFERFWIPDPNTSIAQNLPVDFSALTASQRYQFGTHVGRVKTNKLCIENRVPVDESIVHTFVVSPIPTMINNGVVYVLQQLAKHWHNILAQPFGNWAHHRLEQLDPFQTIRFHIPNVCIVLSSLRGRNVWDAEVLGPFICKCQKLTSSFTAKECLDLVKEMQSNIIHELCAGVVAIENPLSSWLEAIQGSCLAMEKQAKMIYQEVTGVEIGLRLGFDLITQVSWKIPPDVELNKAILLHLQGKYPGEVVNQRNIRRALLSTTPRAKRTLKDLVKYGEHNSKPARVLMRRVKNLLKRHLRREFLNDAIQELSTGEHAFENDLTIGNWYWLNETNDISQRSVFVLAEEHSNEGEISVYRFLSVDTGMEALVSFEDADFTSCQEYIPVAESIVRAQRCYMNLELEHCHKFKYNAFMEFSFLRKALRRLAVVSQIFCEELDNARLNMLHAVKTSNQVKVEVGDLEPGKTYHIHNSEFHVYAPFICKKKYSPSDPEWKRLENVEIVKVPPQSMTVVGASITGLMTAIHCTENVLVSGGKMTLHDFSDVDTKVGSVFERSQIVRLDARWIAMLRYHLGSDFEDVFIPTADESNAHVGNHMVVEGLVEISIKYLECMLHAEVTRLLSKEVIQVFNGSKVRYDPESNCVMKLGEHLQVGDKVLRHVDPNGEASEGFHRWEIANVQYTKALGVKDLRIGEEYDVYKNHENSALTYTLSSIDLQNRTYVFESAKKNVKNIEAATHDLPSVYPKGTKRQAETVFIKCETKGNSNKFHRDRLSENLEGQKFVVDVGHSHVIDCIGKPDVSSVHFQVTPSEPCGFCCVSRPNDSGQASIVIGNSRKSVRQTSVTDEMVALLKGKHWLLYSEKLVEESDFSSLNDKDPIVPKLVEAVEWLCKHAGKFRRQHLQVQVLQAGDNFYLGIELAREYEKWKNDTVDRCLASEKRSEDSKTAASFRQQNIEALKEILLHNIDRLWFAASLKVLCKGGVYDSALYRKIPNLHLIDSLIEIELKHLSVGESFREAGRTRTKYEILFKNKKGVFSRTVEGVVRPFDPTTRVFREGTLARSIENDTESNVAISTFPVSQYVNHRSIRLNNTSNGYVFASFADEQSTSHFIRCSGLTAGGVNIAQFNDFIKAATDGVPLIERFRIYSQRANWSNGEAIQKGTSTNFGQDAFLRLGFSYNQGLKYLRSWVIELMEANQNLDRILSENWKMKFAASMVPRGMELNEKFMKSLREDTNSVIFVMFQEGVMNDKNITRSSDLKDILTGRKDDISGSRNAMNHEVYWEHFFKGVKKSFDDASQRRLRDFHCEVAKRLEKSVSEVIDFAKKAHLYDQRSGQELWNQPKPVGSIIDDFALEAWNYPNSLSLLTVLSAASVALCLYASSEYGSRGLRLAFEICGVIITAINIFISFGILSNIRQYRIRNQQARIIYFDNHFLELKKALFSALDKKYRLDVAMDKRDRKFDFEGKDPFLEDLETKKRQFLKDVAYYGLEDPDEFIYDYRRLVERSNQPAAYKHFQKLLFTYYIPNVYTANSHVQESLTELYKVCEELRTLLTQGDYKTRREGKEITPHLFGRVSTFGPLLEKSFQPSLIGFLSSLHCCSLSTKGLTDLFRLIMGFSASSEQKRVYSIEKETYEIIKEARIVSKAFKGTILKRQIFDLEYLYRSMLEVGKTSMISVVASIVFIASLIFFTSRISILSGATNSAFTMVGMWSQMAHVAGGLLALIYFARNLFKLLWLRITLSTKIKNGAGTWDTKTYNGLGKIRSVASRQIFLRTVRLCALLCSLIALPWAIAQNAFPGKVQTRDSLPYYIALVGFCLAMGTVVSSFLAEYIENYNLPTSLGEYVCKAFHEEIQSMYTAISISQSKFDTKQSQERITWEYVTHEFLHKYRFDFVFGVDHFGSIFRCLQCGIEKAEEIEEDEEQF